MQLQDRFNQVLQEIGNLNFRESRGKRELLQINESLKQIAIALEERYATLAVLDQLAQTEKLANVAKQNPTT